MKFELKTQKTLSEVIKIIKNMIQGNNVWKIIEEENKLIFSNDFYIRSIIKNNGFNGMGIITFKFTEEKNLIIVNYTYKTRTSLNKIISILIILIVLIISCLIYFYINEEIIKNFLRTSLILCFIFGPISSCIEKILFNEYIQKIISRVEGKECIVKTVEKKTFTQIKEIVIEKNMDLKILEKRINYFIEINMKVVKRNVNSIRFNSKSILEFWKKREIYWNEENEHYVLRIIYKNKVYKFILYFFIFFHVCILLILKVSPIYNGDLMFLLFGIGGVIFIKLAIKRKKVERTFYENLKKYLESEVE